MKLTEALCRWKKALPAGNIWRGKYRLVKPVTSLHLAKKRAEFELEEKNMFYLRHPYLTPEQEYSHSRLFNNTEKFKAKITDMRIKKWEKHTLLGDRFGFLKVSDKWEAD